MGSRNSCNLPICTISNRTMPNCTKTVDTKSYKQHHLNFCRQPFQLLLVILYCCLIPTVLSRSGSSSLNESLNKAIVTNDYFRQSRPSLSSIYHRRLKLNETRPYLSNSTSPVLEKTVNSESSLDDLRSDEREVTLSIAWLILLCTVVLSLFVTHLFKCYQIDWLASPLIAIIFGVIVGGLINLGFFQSNSERSVIMLDQILAFNDDVFFIALLPPVVFDSGFSLSGITANHFFKNFGAILWFAIFATIVSFATIGCLFFIASILHVGPTFSLREGFAFGAVMASTDPVVALTLLKSFKAHPLLYSLISEESLMNDAFSIVLYRTIVNTKSQSLLACLLDFGVVFLGSVAIGIAVGLVAALIYKYMNLHKASNQLLESALLLMFVWISYLVSDGVSMSGIVSILFSGITMAHYTYLNLSAVGKKTSENIFGSLSLLAETVVFVLLGIAVFSAPRPNTFDLRLYLSTLIIVCLSRIVSVYATSFLVNLFRRSNKIPYNFQHVIVLCGVRGAVAFALALRTRHDFGERAGSSMLSATLFFAIFTILLISLFLSSLLKRLNVGSSEASREPEISDLHNYDYLRDDELSQQQHNLDLCRVDGAECMKSSTFILATSLNRLRRQSAAESYYGGSVESNELVSGTCGCAKRLLIHLDKSIMKPIFTNETSEDLLSVVNENQSLNDTLTSVRDIELTSVEPAPLFRSV